MRYIFKILVFGNPDTTIPYMSKTFGDGGEEYETYNEWSKEINILEDICDVEVDVITDLIHADVDELIPQSDGMIYFLNPLREEESELFEMIVQIIEKTRHDIPTVIMYYDQSGYLPISVNTLLEHVWITHPNMEAFANLSTREFHQVLHCLCLAIITGDIPLNIENAWMRYPYFVELANNYFKNQNYYYAAQAIKNAAIISEIFNKEDYFIISEQAAYLFSKNNLYLEASKILENIDKRKSSSFKKLYAEAMIIEGNKLFNKKDHELAAKQYESAAQWILIELNDRHLILKSFKLAINSWISACKCKKAFVILERLNHRDVIAILKEVDDKIIGAVEYLDSIGNLESAKEQLYISLNKYQREGLFDNLTKFTYKLIDILIKILNKNVINKEINYCKKIYDEIENIWENFNVEKIDLDSTLEKLIKLFLEEYNFSMSSILINKLNSLELKQTLSKFSSKEEDKNKELKKKEIEIKVQKGVAILNEFFEAEQDIVNKINQEKIKEAREFIKQNEYIKAARHVKAQADFLKNMGMDENANQTLIKSLDISLEGKIFDTFFKYYFEYYNSIPKKMKKNYLIRNYAILVQKLKEIKEEKSYEKNEKAFENASNIFRNLMLFDESQEISRLFIKVIKNEALRIVNSEKDISGINKALELIKKANNISFAHFDNAKITFNKIFKRIAEIFISTGDLSSALEYNDKIENKAFKTEIHEKIEKAETNKIALMSQKVEESLKEEILEERLSIIKNIGRDAKQDKKNELKQRKGLKRAYFKDALNFITNQEFDKAIEIYKESIIRLKNIKKYNLAGVSLAVACLLFMKDNEFDKVKKLLVNTKKELSSLGKSFSETFSIKLIEYIIDIKKIQDELKFKEILPLLEVLPLFEEEKIVLYEYLGKDYQKEEEIKKPIKAKAELARIRGDILNLTKKIEKEKRDIALRKMMKKEYWNKALEEISNNNMLEASKSYLDTVPKLIEKNFIKQAAISLILGLIISIYKEDSQRPKSEINEILKKYYSKTNELEDLPEIEILKIIISSLDYNSNSLNKLALDHFIEKLILFEQEIELLKIFSGEEMREKVIKVALTRDERGVLSKVLVDLDMRYENLQQQLRDEDFDDMFKKRNAMKRRFYEEILTLLTNKSFSEAGSKYYELATKISMRKDFKTSSLLILLYGLVLLKEGESVEKINKKVNEFLESLGLSKSLFRDTFYSTLILFIIDVELNKINQFLPKIKNILEILPLFEEEKALIKI